MHKFSPALVQWMRDQQPSWRKRQRVTIRSGWALRLGGALTLAVPHVLAAQAGDSATVMSPPAAVLAAAAQVITPAELTRHLAALAADSLRGRATSAAALEATARYVAAEFQRLGLQPNQPELSDTAWVKRFPLPGTRQPLDPVGSQLVLTTPLRRARAGAAFDSFDEQGRPLERAVQLNFVATARLAADSLAESKLYSYQSKVTAVQLVSGRQTAATLAAARLCGPLQRSLVLYVPPAGLDSTAQAAVIAALTRCAPVLVVAAEDADTTRFAARRDGAAATSWLVIDKSLEDELGARAWAVYAAPQAVAPVLQAAGLDLAQLWADGTPQVRVVPALAMTAFLSLPPPPTAPSGMYVTAYLRGSDSVRVRTDADRRPPAAASYVTYAASLDGSATAVASAPAAENRAGAAPEPDTELSVAALLALAKAFTQPGARPRRTVLFLVTSGAGQHAAGSHYISRLFDEEEQLTLTLEQLGRGPRDTLALGGLSDFRFVQRPDWLARAHPELGLTVADGGTVLQPGSDGYAFARYGAPGLVVAPTRPAPQSTGPSTMPGATAGAALGAAEATVPAIRFAFYLGQDFANAPTWPRWTPAARAAWARGLGR